MGEIVQHEQNQSAAIIQVIERAASNADIDVDKMERLLSMQERILDRQAEQAFNAAMRAAQAEMPRVKRDAVNEQTRSRYARLETVNRAMVPIITKHGFSLSFGTADCPLPDHVRIVCDVSHMEGHTRRYQDDIPIDLTGLKGNPNKTATHAHGSTTSYGRRYLTLLIFNVAMADEDDDGNGPSREQVEIDQKLMGDMMSAADNGTDAYKAAWQALTPEQRKSLAPVHASLKERANNAGG